MKKLLILWILPLLNCEILYSLEDSTDTKNLLQEEILLEDLETDEDESGLLDYLDNLKRNPLDLNKADLTQLESIPFISSVIAKNILDYRNEVKAFRSKRALLKVKGITDDLYEKVKIYLVVRQYSKNMILSESGIKPGLKKNVKETIFKSRLRTRMLQDLQPKAGFLSGKYEGSRLKLYNQLNAKMSSPWYKLEANITIEKDAGEKSLTDFFSGFLELKDNNIVKEAVAGDYTMNFAQGLAMWSLQAFSKGIDAVNPIKKKGKGIAGYGSVNEVQFFRGGAARINLNSLDLNLFYSDNYYDASVNIAADNVSSFYYDGYHRTTSEIERKNSNRERLIGGRVTYQKGSLRLGSTYWNSSFSKPVIPDSSKQLFKFAGSKAKMLGADYDFILKNMNFFGELARSHAGSVASINAVRFTFIKIADIILSYRNYPMDFAPIHSFGFSERGETYNERGFYAGIVSKPVKGLIVNGYFDQYKFPYRTYFNPVPSSGNDFLVNIEWRAAKGLLVNLKYKNENKEQTETTIDGAGRDVKRMDNRNQLNVRTGFIYQLTERFRLRSRFEFVNVDYEHFGNDNKGYLFFSDISLIPAKSLIFETRFIVFNTDNYDSRIYEFESDIQGVMSNVPLYGEGRRWYLLLKYKLLDFAAISAKYSETFLDGAKSIGSGNDKIQGDINNRLSVGLEAGF